MEVEEILLELEKSGRDGSLQIFRKMITCGTVPCCQVETAGIATGEKTTWEAVLKKLLEILANSRDYGKEQILLIPHAFLVVLSKQYKLEQFINILKSYLFLDNNFSRSFDTDYQINDINFFKLLITHGYLQVNRKEIYVEELLELTFGVLYCNCVRYTRYTHLAYKVLEKWLKRTCETDFWNNDHPNVEKQLEVIIYSNWDNSIKEVSKQNSTTIFNQYLRIMNRKYQGFIEFVFNDCLHNTSWSNESKYVILSEICDVWENVEALMEANFVQSMLTSLTKNYLRSSGTKLYNAITNKLSDDQWKNAFGIPISIMVLQWGSGPQKDHQALQFLCTQWLEPTVKKRRFLLNFLWELNEDVPDVLFRSHLARISSETRIILKTDSLPNLSQSDHCDENLRLNSFAAHCQKNISTHNNDLQNHFKSVKYFLFYNANSSSTFLRRGIIKYFKLFLLNLLKLCNVKENLDDEVICFFNWLHNFLLDSFEIGSCYQRKVLGLKLYDLILFYTNERVLNIELKSDPRYREDLCNGFETKRKLEKFGKWTFTCKRSLLWLLKLILDPSVDIREISTEIIIEHFEENSLEATEKKVLFDIAISKCSSAKFYETESGSMFLRILSKWFPFKELIAKIENEDSFELHKSLKLHTGYTEYFLHEAKNQLYHLRQDILKAAAQNSPFHGVLTALLNVGFRNNLSKESINEEFLKNLLALLEDAVHFLLSLLSSKSTSCELSSSFAEVGLAINETVQDSEICDEYDDIVLSPAYQVVITCIWISLKVSCELSSEIGMLTISSETVERSANLITSVLMKCRHKGAIEAAGVAIGLLTRKLVNVMEYKNLPEEWLNNLISSNKITPNLTRRSAGLSIMFHRIVANDTRHGKPIVHIAVRNLLDLLDNNEETTIENESYQDLPRAKHLHFLQRLVADSDLHAQVVPYLERITMTCFKNLESEIWTVRNASLQLFGVIVPRITGQHRGGQTLEFGNGYSVEHFITHYEKLANHLFMELKNAAFWNNDLNTTLKIHSAVVPSLILFTRMSTGGSDLIDYSSKTYIVEVKYYLKILFASSIGNVRLLAAKAYTALVEFPWLTQELENLKQDLQKRNHPNIAHGYRCAIKYLGERLKVENNVDFVSSASNDVLRESLLDLTGTNILIEKGQSMAEILEYFYIKALDDDEVVRMSAAECLVYLFMNFGEIENVEKLKILRICLSLLKDEASDIREITRTSLVNILKHGKNAVPLLGEILYYRILSDIIMNEGNYANYLNIEVVDFFLDCIESINCGKESTTLVESPFDHEADATSAEETKLLNILFYGMSILKEIKALKNYPLHDQNRTSIDFDCLMQSNIKFHSKTRIDFTDLKTILDLSYNDYMTIKKNVALELCKSISIR
ncbi:uncharacterized protein LOC105691871 [Athalia rosae]|uniref:uncharacterized protein LOC105691871 n=1 Tax=Athalia rosae TaxID=37344 RepID=UPI002033758F|nr:uncharacterized protein LOC105691871 [Athalia rosae]